MRVLLIEDDKMIGEAISVALKDEAFAVDWSTNAKHGELAFSSHDYILVLLDLTLPDGDGLVLLEKLRLRSSDIPVIIITARESVRDRIIGLDKGADDYLAKPFEIDELLARMRAVMRRRLGPGHI